MQIATFALGKPFILLGMITMFTSYLSLSMSMMDTFYFDFGKTRTHAWLITIAIPLVLYSVLTLLQQAAFVTVLSVGGIISGSITAILILAMVRRAKQQGNRSSSYTMPSSKYLLFILALLFIIGAGAEIIQKIISFLR